VNASSDVTVLCIGLDDAASVDEASAPSRIDFAFDLAYFEIRSLPPFGFKPPGGPIR
jgi:hypothetical protein